MNIYDFDKTIYDGDSSIDFFKFSLSCNKKILLDVPFILIAMFLYLIKVKEKEYLKSVFFRFLRRIDVDEYVVNFWKKNDCKMRQFYLDNHRDSDIVVSASPEFLLKPVSVKYHFKLIATLVDVKSGNLKSKNCHDREKVVRLKQQGITQCNQFYSDSLSDEPCRKLAMEAFIVKDNRLIPWDNYQERGCKKLARLLLNRDFITFCFIGVINACNGIWIAYVYSLYIRSAILAYIFGFCTSLCIAYFLNSFFNFKDSMSFQKFYKFVISNIPNFLIQVFSVVILLNALHFSKLISYVVSAVVTVPITFLLVKIYVFTNND